MNPLLYLQMGNKGHVLHTYRFLVQQIAVYSKLTLQASHSFFPGIPMSPPKFKKTSMASS